MSHLNEEELILHHYGEADDPDSARAHLSVCPGCREELDALVAALDGLGAPDAPERPADYGARVWDRLAPELRVGRTSGVRPRSGWIVLAAAALLLVTFLAGRFSTRWAPGPEPGSERIRERILLVALGDHLQESQVLLLEIANGGVLQASALDQERAEKLLAESRLYRQTASRVGDVVTADVLEELERLLLDVAHGPRSTEALAALRSRIEDRDMLFKLRVLQASVTEKAPRRF